MAKYNNLKRITQEQAHYYKYLDSNKYSPEYICYKAQAFSLHEDPNNPGWETVNYYSESPFASDGKLRPTEFIYVLVNPSIPGQVKIGMTTRDVDKRAKEISSHTGVPTPWHPIFSFACFNSLELETELHDYLADKRVNDAREMFYMHATDAIKIIEDIGGKYALPPVNPVSE